MAWYNRKSNFETHSDIPDEQKLLSSDWNDIVDRTWGTQEAINVMDPNNYGAEGNGSTNDTPAIQDAVDAVLNAGGGIVYFPPGDYKLDDTISIPHSATDVYISLVGSGRQSKLIAPSGKAAINAEGSGAWYESAGACTGRVIEKLYFTSESWANRGLYGIHFEGIVQSIIRDCWFYHLTNGIYLDTVSTNTTGSWANKVINNDFEVVTRPIYINQGHDTIVEGNHSEGITENAGFTEFDDSVVAKGIHFNGCCNGVIGDNAIEGVKDVSGNGVAFHIEDQNAEIMIDNNYVGGAANIGLLVETNNVIAGTQMIQISNCNADIEITPNHSSYAPKIQISNCNGTVDLTGTLDTINLDISNLKGTFGANVTSMNGGWITLSGSRGGTVTLSDVTLDDLSISGCSSGGFSIEGNSNIDNMTVSGNTINGYVLVGDTALVTNLAVTGNILTGMSIYAGIARATASAEITRATITGNTCDVAITRPLRIQGSNTRSAIAANITAGTDIGKGETRTLWKEINYNDSSPISICPVESGYAVTDAWVEVTTTFDDTGTQTLDIGDGGDADGFLANTNIDLTNTGYYGINEDEKGAYIFDSANNHSVTKVYPSDDTIDATLSVGNGDGTQGQAIVYVKITKIGG